MSKKNHVWLLLLPFLLVTGCLLFYALGKALVTSLGYYPLLGMKGWTLEYFIQVFHNPYFLKALGYTFFIALVASLLSVILGFSIAITKMNEDKDSLLTKFMALPIGVPHILLMIALLQMIQQTGLISRVAYYFQLIDDPNQFPLFVHDRHGIGIFLVYLWKQVPYIFITVIAVLKNCQKKYVAAAKNLGANRWQIIRHILWPQSRNILFDAFIIIFSFDFGSYEVPLIMGNAKNETLAILAYQQYSQPDLLKRPYTMAINILMIVISAGFALILLMTRQYLSKKRGKSVYD